MVKSKKKEKTKKSVENKKYVMPIRSFQIQTTNLSTKILTKQKFYFV